MDISAILNVDQVYDYKEVWDQLTNGDKHPERPPKTCTNCGETGHTQNGFKTQRGDTVNYCQKWIRDPIAPQVDTNWLACRPVLKDLDNLWHQRRHRNHAIAETTKQCASGATARLLSPLTKALATAIKEEKSAIYRVWAVNTEQQ